MRRTQPFPHTHSEPNARDSHTAPAPHDPTERLMMYWLGDWDVYAFDPAGEMHEYMAKRKMFHLQLWHPQAQVSVLTASALTGHQFELYPFQGWKARTDTWQEVTALVHACFYLDLPKARQIDHTYRALRGEFTRGIPGTRLPACRFL